MKKKEIKSIRRKLIVSIKKTLTANNKSLINAIEKDLKKSNKVVSSGKVEKSTSNKKPEVLDA